MSFNLSVTAQHLNAAVTKENEASPQSTTYTKAETNALLSGKQDTITTITDTGTMTNDTTIADTGVGVDIPADGGISQVSGCITWKGSTPTEAQLRVRFGARSTVYIAARVTNENNDSLNFMYLSPTFTLKADEYHPEDADKTIHVNVWGKTSAATGSSDVMLIARKISN